MEERIEPNAVREPRLSESEISGSERVSDSVRERVGQLAENAGRSGNGQTNVIPDFWIEEIFSTPKEVPVSEERNIHLDGKGIQSSLDISARTPIRRLWFAITNTSVARKLSENALDQAGIAGIFATLASAPTLNLGSNVWLYHSVAKPLSGIDFLSFSSISGTVGWTLFIGGMSVSLVNFLISRGRLFNVWTFCKLAISNNPQIAHLHLQRNLRDMEFADLRTKLDLFSDDVIRSLSEIGETGHEAFRGIREVRMSSWMLDKPRIRREMIGRIRSEGFDCEEIPGGDERIGIWKKLGLCSLTVGKKGFFRFAKGMFSRKMTEGGIRVRMENPVAGGAGR